MRGLRLASILHHLEAFENDTSTSSMIGTLSQQRACVCIAYCDLASSTTSVNPSLQLLIADAYGFSGLGILAVTGVPGVASARQDLLPMAAQFAALPAESKQKTETPHAFYQVGWSHGNEKLQGNRPDWAKGSYYANPLVDVPSTDADLVQRFPSFLEPNRWPTEDLPGFERAFKTLGRVVVRVGEMVAKQCDDFVVSECPGYDNGKLRRLVRTSKCCKGRLLHYYPTDEVEELMAGANQEPGDSKVEPEMDLDNTFSDWCGWHNDHGSLTGLVPSMYMNRAGEEVSNPDAESGLYVRSRMGQLVQVILPTGNDTLAFQIGETSQIHSGGVLQATPHAVRGPAGEAAQGISRECVRWHWHQFIPLPPSSLTNSLPFQPAVSRRFVFCMTRTALPGCVPQNLSGVYGARAIW